MAPVVDIVFQNNVKFFFGGSNVFANVMVTTSNAVAVKQVKVKVQGFCNVRFQEIEENKNVTRHSHEVYYTLNLNVWGDGSNAQTLPAGTHYFPFSFQIPSATPNSFESEHGYVRHTCKAMVDFANSFLYVNHTVPYSVGYVYDLNMNPISKNPIMMAEEKTICCLCCKGGFLSFAVNIGHRGYVPGERMIINAECSNRSNNATDYTSAEIIQVVKYNAQGRMKTSESVVATLRHNGVPPGQDDIWAGELLAIPPLPPTGLPGCAHIDIQYKLKFCFSPSGFFSMNLTASEDLVIGSIPIREVFDRFSPQAQPFQQHAPSFHQQGPPVHPQYPPQGPSVHPQYPPQGPSVHPQYLPQAPPSGITDAPPPYPWAEQYPELPRPLFKECENSCHSNASDAASSAPEGLNFIPQYPTYGWNS